MDIAVIGAGYVGLTTAACLAEIGHQVSCAEGDPQKLALLKGGGAPFFEPQLESLMRRNRETGRLSFCTTPEAIGSSRAIFICVGTPPLENGEADLAAIENVARSIAQQAVGYRLVIEKSTVPVQTGRQLQKHLARYSSSAFSYDVASNPEFLREGSAVGDFFHPDRIVVGSESAKATEILQEIYQPILTQQFVCPVHDSCPPSPSTPFLVTDINSAEIVKHASNSFLAMKISFINLIADLCEAAGADVTQVARGIGLDQRIGRTFLRPGIGFGGFCFPKDLQAFVRIAEKLGVDFSLLREVEKINQRRIEQFVERVRAELWVLRDKKICCWGLAFKPNTDDIRFAPSLAIIRRLLAEGAEISAYDPQATEKAKATLPAVRYCDDPYEAVKGAEALLVLTEWDEFETADLERVRSLMERPLIIDGRNVFPPEKVASCGLQYVSLGRPATSPETVTKAVVSD
ncbi:MAG TPA: UDP-glucose/GDP-mannose dehydrogenase family protein [Terriglobia bacterium]|nr:UDP-glucose/GDP-mannose dehydrogenase family protein [Terriglobia bacterium]